MKKIVLTLLLSLVVLFNSAGPTNAAFTFTPPSLYLGQAVPIYYHWNPSIKAYFILLNNVKKVSYNVTYLSNEVPQGISGSFDVTSKKTIAREFFLGTCSGNNCVPHTNIKNLALEVTFTYKDNHTETKLYHL